MKNKNKIAIVIVVLILILAGGITLAVRNHTSPVNFTAAAKMSQLSKAEAAVSKAYASRSRQDIKFAEKAIAKLENRNKEKEESKLERLISMLSKLDKVKAAIATYKKTYKAKDGQTAQNLINQMTESYLAKDKTREQALLDAITKSIKKTGTSASKVESKSSSSAGRSSKAKTESAADNSAGPKTNSSNSQSNSPKSSAEDKSAAGSNSHSSGSSSTNENEVTITAGYTKTFSFDKGESLLTLIKDKMGAQATMAGFITAVGGLEQDTAKHQYIMFKVNGVESPVGAASVILKAGDKVEFYMTTYK